MSPKKQVTAMVSAILLVGFGLASPNSNMTNSAMAQSSQEVSLSAAKSAMAASRIALSEFDTKLEFPMSEIEKKKSQNEVNLYRQSLRLVKADSNSPKEIKSLAEQSLKLAKSACQEADSGDRSRAVSQFTEARKKLYKAKHLLKAWESRIVSSGATPKLNARAEKKDQLLSAGKARTAGYNRSGSSTNSNTDMTSVNIGPGGIHVQERNPNGVTSTNVNISPSGISVNDRSPAGERTNVNIGAGNGSLGQSISDLVTGTVGAALGTARVATETALGTARVATESALGANNSGNYVSDKNTITISGHNIDRTLTLKGQNVLVTGHNNDVTVLGFCNKITVTGHNNNATVERVARISVSGHNNDVYWKNGVNNKTPQLGTTGNNNSISRVR